MAFLLAFLGCGTGQAEELSVTTCIVPLAEGDAVSELMAQPEAFDCGGDERRFGQGDFLVQLHFRPLMANPGDPLVLRMGSVWQDRGDIIFRYADGATEHLEFTSHDVSRFMTIGSVLEFPVPLYDAPLQTVFVEMRGAGNGRGVVLSPQLMSLSDSHAIELVFVGSYAGFAALAMTLAIYNLSLWKALRHRFQLLYCAVLVAFVGYTFIMSGAATLMMPSLDNKDLMRGVLVLLVLAQVGALQFISEFFEMPILWPRARLLVQVAGSVAIMSALAFAVLAPWHFQLLISFYIASLSGVLCVATAILICAWRSGSSYFALFLLAWSAPLAVAGLRLAYGLDLVGYSLFMENANLIAVSIQALLSALMVTARVRELSLERDDAVAGEQVALRLANTDPLTGLLNRRAFMDLAIGRTSLHRLLLIDIDHFKRVNDRLGHEVGDQVLTAVTQAIQGCRPPRSLAVRLGGEEFGILLPSSSFDRCPAEMLLEAVRNAPMPCDVDVTVSIGFADGSVASENDWKRLYRFADSALYRAKSDGRDRACRATDFSFAA